MLQFADVINYFYIELFIFVAIVFICFIVTGVTNIIMTLNKPQFSKKITLKDESAVVLLALPITFSIQL